MKLCTGHAAASPSAQMVWPSILLATSTSMSMSAFLPCPAMIRFEHAVHPAGAFAARRALAAGLRVIEAREALAAP